MVRVDADLITDWPTFHKVFSDIFGFPGFYGCNMDAWIDCLSCLDDPSAEMSSVHVQPGQPLSLVIDNAQSFKQRCPEQFFCSAGGVRGFCELAGCRGGWRSASGARLRCLNG